MMRMAAADAQIRHVSDTAFWVATLRAREGKRANAAFADPLAATLAGELGYSDAAIAKCLDHAVTKDDGEKVHRVTGIYNQSKRMQQKRNVLDGIAVELRRIVGDDLLRMVA